MDTASNSTEHLDLVRSYLTALENGAVGDDLAKFFTPEAIQIEWPNRLNPTGGQSDLDMLLARAAQGKKLLQSQTYTILSSTIQANQVAIEAEWNAVLAVKVASFEPGSQMRAHFAMFFELEDGRIRLQRNYDCFEPW